jgi:DNA repair ATPase RecN
MEFFWRWSWHRIPNTAQVRIENALFQILGKVNKMATELEGTEAAVERLEKLVAGVAVQLVEITTALNNATSANDPVRLAEVNRRLGALTKTLLDAGNTADITPETPLEPPPVVEPPVDLPPGETPV